jgi:hypothetical protein
MGKNAAAVMAALIGVALYQVLWKLDLGRVALPTTLVTALGSNLWTVGSQGLWQHGPAALCLILSLLLLLPGSRPRLRLALSGLTLASLVWCRPNDVVLAAAAFLWVARYRARDLVLFLPLPILLAGILLFYNLWFFGKIDGGYSQIDEFMKYKVMRLSQPIGTWSLWPAGESLIGTLLSPNRGLFVFSPWTVIALVAAPAAARRLGRSSPATWLLWGLVPFYYTLTAYYCWWGGHSFGPRFWTDVMPLFGVLLGFGLDWSRTHCRLFFWSFIATIAVSVCIQLMGAFCYPSSWNTSPIDVEHRTDRIWDWRDTELSRCFTEGVRPAEW